jgi:hypothetical protein
MLTPNQLRDTKTRSGYKHVRKVGGQPSLPKTKPYYQAQHMPGSGDHGPGRKTALEAAQDYCDWVNGRKIVPAPALKRAAHPKAKRKKITPAQQVALDILRDARAKPKAMGWVYLVVETRPWGLDFERGKVGWTSKNPPEARLNDYQAGNPRKLVMIGKIKGTKRKESNIHKRHIAKNVLGEWFRLDDALLSEFGLKKEDIT